MYKGLILSEYVFMNNNYECLVILTNYLHYNILNYLKELDSTHLDLVFGVHKGSTHGGYLPIYMVGDIISVNKYLTLAQYYPRLPSVVDMYRISLEGYLSSWASSNQTGIFTCE